MIIFKTCHSVILLTDTKKYLGKTYHDGVKFTDWVLYRKGNEMNELNTENSPLPAEAAAINTVVTDANPTPFKDASAKVEVEVKHVQDAEVIGGEAV